MAVADAPRLAQYQAVPRDQAPQRLPTFPNIENTSVLKFEQTFTLDVGTFQCDGDIMVVRNPAFPIWKTVNPTGKIGSVYIDAYCPAGLAFPTAVGSSTAPLSSIINDLDLHVYHRVGADSSTLFPAYPYGYDNDSLWFYNPGVTFTVIVNLTNELSGGVSTMMLTRTGNFSTADVDTFYLLGAVSGTTMVFSTGVSGWIKLGSISTTTTWNGTAALSSFNIGITTSGTLGNPTALGSGVPMWVPASPAPPEYSRATMIYAATRCNALAVLFQNSSKVMYKEGSVQAIRVPIDKAEIFNTSPIITNMLPDVAASQRYLGLLEKGAYTFVPPDASTGVFRDWTGNFGQPAMALNSFSYANFIRFTDPDTTNPTPLLVTVDTHLEFRNTTMLWDIGVSALSLEEWHRAQLALASIPCFHENPTHLAAIASLAKAAATRLLPYATPILKAAYGAARPMANQLITSAASKADSFIRSKLQPQIVLRQQKAKKPKAAKAKVKRKK